MYRKILVPLDGSKDAEGVIPLVQGELAPDGEAIVLQIIPPGKSQSFGGQVFLGSQREDADRSRAQAYLKGVLRRVDADPQQWRCDVSVSESVARGIVDFAAREKADLIAMYTHDRKGLAAFIKKSIAKDVLRRAQIEVKVFTPKELAVGV